MNIVIVCSCLEAGKDGVGDYCYTLSEQLYKLGHTVHLLSWNDPYVTESKMESNHKILRLPRSYKKCKRTQIASKWLKEISPELISIQIVSYGFQKKGILLDHCYFRKLTKGIKTHIHFHELWIGTEANATWKSQLVGIIQRYCLVTLVKFVRPYRVTTSIELYLLLLGEMRVSVSVLPIFSNISYVPEVLGNNESKFSIEICSRLGIMDLDSRLKVVMFGRIYPMIDLSTRLATIKEQNQNKSILCIHLGRTSQESILNLMKICESVGVEFLSLGEMEPQQISCVIRMSDFGCSLMSGVFSLKSGANHALFEHGKKVFYIDDFLLPNGLDPLDYKRHPGLFSGFNEIEDFKVDPQKEKFGALFVAQKMMELCQ